MGHHSQDKTISSLTQFPVTLRETLHHPTQGEGPKASHPPRFLLEVSKKGVREAIGTKQNYTMDGVVFLPNCPKLGTALGRAISSAVPRPVCDSPSPRLLGPAQAEGYTGEQAHYDSD